MKNYTIFLFYNNLNQTIMISFNISSINSEIPIFEKLNSKMNYVVLYIMNFSDKSMNFLDILQP